MEDIRKDLIELKDRIERIGKDVSDLKKDLEKYFTKDEAAILRYEASIGRSFTKVEILDNDSKKTYADACRRYLAYGAEIEACLNRKLSQTTAVWVGKTPQVLIDAGCKYEDMYITQKHLRNILRSNDAGIGGAHYHDIDMRQFRQLPELLADPLVIAAMEDHPNRLIAVLNVQDKQGNPLIVPIEKDGRAFYKDKKVNASFILSVYGKKNIERYLTKAEIIYIDKKIDTRLGVKPLQLRQFLTTVGAYNNNIPQNDQNVNKNTKKSRKENSQNTQKNRDNPDAQHRSKPGAENRKKAETKKSYRNPVQH